MPTIADTYRNALVGPQMPRGMIRPGNLDIYDRAPLRNPNGSISTMDTITVGGPGPAMNYGGYPQQVVIPQVINGTRFTPREAIQHYRSTGENFGSFNDPDIADAYAEAIHNMAAQSMGLGRR